MTTVKTKGGRPYSERWFGYLISIAGGVVAFFVAWKWSTTSIESLLDASQKLAFINSGFIVAAFNLRFKMLDILAKDWFKRSEFDELSRAMEGCTNRINRQIIFYVLVSAAMACAPLAEPLILILRAVVVATCFFLFILGLAKFLQLLFSFSRLEDFACTAIKRDIERKSRAQQQALFRGDDE